MKKSNAKSSQPRHAGMLLLLVLLARGGGQKDYQFLHTKMMQTRGDAEGLTLVRTPLPLLDAINARRNLIGVEDAEPNYCYQYNVTSNGTHYTNGTRSSFLKYVFP